MKARCLFACALGFVCADHGFGGGVSRDDKFAKESASA
jgi:hypothetical protein